MGVGPAWPILLGNMDGNALVGDVGGKLWISEDPTYGGARSWTALYLLLELPEELRDVKQPVPHTAVCAIREVRPPARKASIRCRTPKRAFEEDVVLAFEVDSSTVVGSKASCSASVAYVSL